MEITILEKTEQPEMKRTALSAQCLFSGAIPSRKDVREALAKKTQTEAALIIVDRIQPQFGATKVKVHATIYADEKSLSAIAHKHLQKRHAEKKAEE